MQEVLDSISYKIAMQQYCVKVLRLWDLVIQAGIKVEDVESFTFRPDFLPREDRAKLNRASWAAKRDASKHWHNCVKLTEGSLKPITLTQRPKEPEKPDAHTPA